MTVLVASTIAPYKCVKGQDVAWLRNAEFLQDDTDDAVEFFVAIEQDDRGDVPFADLIWRMQQLDGTVWRFRIDDGAYEITSGNRLFRICAGRNMAIEYALRHPEITHILWIDTDTMVPNDAIEKLLELDALLQSGVVGGHVGIYNLGHEQEVLTDVAVMHPGAMVSTPTPVPAEWQVKKHWNTAGFLMVRRDVFSKVTWHYDPDAGDSDDPAYQHLAEMLGHPTYVRHDVLGQHVKIPMVAIEDREGHDRTMYKAVA